MRTLTLRLVLCVFLLMRVSAAPISYEQVTQQVQSGQPPTDPQKSAPPTGQLPESSDKPDFVRLADGRIVPYGPGIICSDDCVQSDALALDDPLKRLPTRGLRPWFFIPAAIGGLAVLALLRGSEVGTPPVTPEPPRIVTPPTPPVADVPEPATLMLLGLGLAMMARHGFGRKKPQDK